MSKTSENPNLIDVDHDYKETKPQLQVVIDRDRAGDLGVSIEAISRTLESKLGSRRVTTFIEDGEEYDVIWWKAEEKMFRSPSASGEHPGSLGSAPVGWYRSPTWCGSRNSRTPHPSTATTASGAITIEANLTDGYRLGEALTYLNDLVRTELPPAGCRSATKENHCDVHYLQPIDLLHFSARPGRGVSRAWPRSLKATSIHS